jgi:thiol-disulfide isomerase/thioredoxin
MMKRKTHTTSFADSRCRRHSLCNSVIGMMMMMRLDLVLRSLAFLVMMSCHFFYNSAVLAVPIDVNSYETLTKDKNSVFLKLYIDWCTKCKELAPAWEALEKEWKDHPTVLIGEIDCGNSINMEWCDDAFHITGVPTLLYGDPSNDGMYLEEYRDTQKDTESLSNFAKATLTQPVCNPNRFEGCTEKDRTLMESYWGRSIDDLDQEIHEKEAKIQGYKDAHENAFNQLQKQYNAMEFEKSMNAIDIKDNIRILNEVKQELTSMSKEEKEIYRYDINKQILS